ncbi:MAG: hypothetical protein PUI07_00675 [Clostridiales bacterium]|nr:hypothetical protein [Clostridiales bacterium]
MKRIKVTSKTGQELFLGMPHSLLEYWAWAHSDIVSNSERGILAEYLVRCAVHAPSPCRIEWDAVDVISPEGIRIEVKSSAYLQTWKQEKLSRIQFDIAPKNAWDSVENSYASQRIRSADVYVFCLFNSKDPNTANPMDLAQWEFYVLATSVLNELVPKQKSISLTSLQKLGAKKVSFEVLYTAIRLASKEGKNSQGKDIDI